MFLRQSTAQTIRFGPCLDKTDGVTEETALTLAQADMRLSKDGGAFAQKSAAGNATHDSDGWYSTALSTTDTATVGELILNVHQAANMLPVWMRFWVLEEAIYDALFGAAAAGFNASGLVTLAAVTHTGAVIPTCTTNTDMRGTDSALLAANVPTNFADLAIAVTTGRVDLGLWLGVAPNALISGRVDTDVAVVNTGAISTTSFAAGAVDASALAANVITSSELADSATPRILKNTALANFMFLMVDSTDHVTPKTGLTFGAGDSQRSLNGAAFANTASLPTEVGSGIYKVNLATTDLNADVITFRFDGTAADSRLITILTQPV